VVDFSVDNKRAKPYLSQLLQRAAANGALVGAAPGPDGRGPGACFFRGTVEFVYSGSRIKVLVPSESCVLSLTLAQIRVPLPARKENAASASAAASSSSSSSSSSSAARPAEPFADEARAFTRRHVNQRTVELRLDDVDKNGIGLGRLYLQEPVVPSAGPSCGGGDVSASLYTVKPFAAMPVADGLARVERRFQPTQPDAATDRERTELLAAQEAAMAAKKGLWSVPGAVEAETKATADPAEAAGAEVGDDSGGKPPHSGPSLRGDEERCRARGARVRRRQWDTFLRPRAGAVAGQAVEQALAGVGAGVVEKLDGVPNEEGPVGARGRAARAGGGGDGHGRECVLRRLRHAGNCVGGRGRGVAGRRQGAGRAAASRRELVGRSSRRPSRPAGTTRRATTTRTTWRRGPWSSSATRPTART
jgi:endonuclease YncB( thermonuclease family)